MRTLALLGLMLLPMAAAGQAGQADQAGHGYGGPPTEWATVDVGPLNAKADAAAEAAWVRSPLQLVLTIFGVDNDAAALFCEVRKPYGASARRALVTLVHDGCRDDAVRSSWIEAECRCGDDGTWRLVGVRSAQRCRRAPEPQAWTATPCP